MEGISEILFGLIMLLTLTCSFSVAEADGRLVHDMLLAAVGCNFAWDAIDAVLYLFARFSEQGRAYSHFKRCARQLIRAKLTLSLLLLCPVACFHVDAYRIRSAYDSGSGSDHDADLGVCHFPRNEFDFFA
jgi:hypothetical protein